jgi:hypothetical protein
MTIVSPYEEDVGDDKNVICLHDLCAPHGVAQVAIYRPIGPQGTEVVNVWIAEIAMF